MRSNLYHLSTQNDFGIKFNILHGSMLDIGMKICGVWLFADFLGQNGSRWAVESVYTIKMFSRPMVKPVRGQ